MSRYLATDLLPELANRFSETFGKKLVGRTAIEDALERLKTVTEDEARTAAEAMKAIYGVGGRMQLGMQGIHDAVRDFKETNQSNDDKMKGVGDMVVVGAPKNVEPLISALNIHTITGRKSRTTDGDRP